MIRRFYPTKFELRERVLSGVAVVLAAVAFYLVATAKPRAAPGVWLQWQFLGTLLFIAISGRDRAFFTGLYCHSLSGAIAVLATVISAISAIRMPWPSDGAAWLSVIGGLVFGAFGLAFSVAVPVVFALSVTRLIDYLEQQFSK